MMGEDRNLFGSSGGSLWGNRESCFKHRVLVTASGVYQTQTMYVIYQGFTGLDVSKFTGCAEFLKI